MYFCKNDCYQCFSLCPKRGGSFNYIKQLGGGLIELEPNDYYALGHHIPIFPDRLTEILEIENDVIGIHGGNLLSLSGSDVINRYKKKRLKDVLNLKTEKDCLIEFYVKDRTLEGFWDHRKTIYMNLKKLPIRVIVAPNFSVYEDAPRIDHLYNMKRSSIVYNEMIQLGLPAVPDISWYNQIDLDQWIREINKKKIKTIAFSFQVVDVRLKASSLWKHYLMGFKYLCLRLHDDVQIIIAGVVSPDRLSIINRASNGKKLIILNQTAYVRSRRGILADTGEKAPKTMSKNDILLYNLNYFNEAYDKLKSEVK